MNKLSDYGVPEGNILGIKYGFKGFYNKDSKPIVLTRRSVEGIHLEGGTMLGTSRGGADMTCVPCCPCGCVATRSPAAHSLACPRPPAARS